MAGEDFTTCDAQEGTTDAVTDMSGLVEEARFEQATALPVGTGDSGAAAVELVADARMETALDTEISVLLEKSRSKSSKNETNLEYSLASQIAPVVDRSTGAVSKQKVNTAFRDALKSKIPLGAEGEKSIVRLSSINISRRQQNGRRNSSTLLRGMRKDGTSTFRAVKGTIDIFVGRVHKDTTEEDIMKFVRDTLKLIILL